MDVQPLNVKMDYTKDFRYFGKSFRRILTKAVRDAGLSMGAAKMEIARCREEVEVVGGPEVNLHGRVDRVLYVKGSIRTEDGTEFGREIYVKGNATLGIQNRLVALAADGDVFLGPFSEGTKWIDAEGCIDAGEGCRLGRSVTAGKRIFLGAGCRFLRLFGNPVETGGREAVAGEFAGTVKINGSVKINGDLTIDTRSYVVIEGNLFVDGYVKILSPAWIKGNIFSQKGIYLNGVQVGEPGKVKSVVGKMEVILGRGVKVFGLVLTEGEGRVEV